MASIGSILVVVAALVATSWAVIDPCPVGSGLPDTVAQINAQNQKLSGESAARASLVTKVLDFNAQNLPTRATCVGTQIAAINTAMITAFIDLYSCIDGNAATFLTPAQIQLICHNFLKLDEYFSNKIVSCMISGAALNVSCLLAGILSLVGNLLGLLGSLLGLVTPEQVEMNAAISAFANLISKCQDAVLVKYKTAITVCTTAAGLC